MVYGAMPQAVLVTQLVWWQAETMGWEQNGRSHKSSSQLHCHAQRYEAIWQDFAKSCPLCSSHSYLDAITTEVWGTYAMMPER